MSSIIFEKIRKIPENCRGGALPLPVCLLYGKTDGKVLVVTIFPDQRVDFALRIDIFNIQKEGIFSGRKGAAVILPVDVHFALEGIFGDGNGVLCPA